MSWKIESLHRLFNPKTIAVIGASDKAAKLGGLTLLALDDFNGDVFPVNPRLSDINGQKCYSTINEIPNKVDLAIIALQAPLVLQTVTECSEAAVGSAIIFSAGFKELGPIGEQTQRELKEIANRSKIAIIGPNCLGAGNLDANLNATFFPMPVPPKRGKVSLASQSGGVAGLMMYAAADSDVGISKFASVGNRVNVDFPDLLRYFRDDEETEVICLFIEGTEQGRELYSEMAEVGKAKPVVVYKVGKTPASREAALSHTGSMAGAAELYSAAFRQAKAIEVDNVQEMMDTAKVLSFYPTTVKGRRVAIVTHTLGPALIAAQILEQSDVQLPVPNEDISHKIQNLLEMPVDVRISNPIDLLAQGWAKPDIFAKSFELVVNSDQYDAIMTIFSPNYQEDIGGGMPVDSILRCMEGRDEIVIAVLNSPESRHPPGRSEFEQGGIPVFSSPERGAYALARVLSRV